MEWRDEWNAEIAHAARRAAHRPLSARIALVRRCLGAFPDGFALFGAEWRAALHPEALAAAFRELSRTPIHFLLQGTAIALAWGAALGTISAARTMLRSPLPFADADRFVTIEHGVRISGALVRPFSAGEFQAIRANSPSLDEVCASRRHAEQLHGERGPVPISAASVSCETFDLYRVKPLLGRGLRSSDSEPGAEPVVVLSSATWRAAFRSSRDVIGRHVVIGGDSRRVVGVMPPVFAAAERGTDAWLPLAIEAGDAHRNESRDLRLTGRLRRGADPGDAREEITAALAGSGPECELPQQFAGVAGVRIAPPIGQRVPRPMVLALFAALSLLGLSIVSARTWVGGGLGPSRLSRVIAFAGTAALAAIPVGVFVLSSIEVLAPKRFDPSAFGVDPAAAGALGLGTLAAFLRGPQERAVVRRTWWKRALAAVVGSALLAASGDALRLHRDRATASLGFETAGLWALDVHCGGGSRAETARRVVRSVQRVDGVAWACVASPAPLGGVLKSVSVAAESGASVSVEACVRSIDDDYCGALGVSVHGADRVSQGALINETLAKRLWPGRADPTGETIRVLLDDWKRMPVAGVVSNVPQSAASLEAQPEILIAFDVASSGGDPDPRRFTLLVRAADASAGTDFPRQLRRALEREDSVALGYVRSLDSEGERSRRKPRAAVGLAGLGSLLGLSLAVLGFASSPAPSRSTRRIP